MNLIFGRYDMNLSQAEKLKFEDAVHIFRSKREAEEHNLKKLIGLNNTLYRMESTNYPESAKDVKEDNFNGLKRVLYLSIGAKVFLCKNLNTEAGLFNSSEGEIMDIIYEKNADPTRDLPNYVLVKFEKYEGQKNKVFPVFPITVTNDKNYKQTRTQLPLVMSYGMTVYKI